MEPWKKRAFAEGNALYHLTADVYRRAALAVGLSDSAFDVLYCLRELGDGCLQKDVCAASFLTKQTVNSSVHKLVREGVIRLETERGRGTHLYLTPLGLTLVKERIDPVIRAEAEAYDVLTREEAEQMLRWSRLYTESLSKKVDELPALGR